WKDGKNAMYDGEDDYCELSQTGRYYVGGILAHAKALTAVCCPTVSSYKRLVPGFEAPIYVMWSRRNRSALARIPLYYKGPEYAAQKSDEVLQRALGSHIFDAFIELKTNDWNQYCLYVSPWEIMKYLDY